jgi:putative membrane protein insertion efficiency factor
VSGAVVALIRFYQRAAPAAVRGTCRFTPTCSEYTIRSIEKYGAFRGVGRGFRRLLRCHAPNGGVDEP